MPNFSSLISYRPKRKEKQGPHKVVSTSLPSKSSSTTPTYFTRVLDIYDETPTTSGLPESKSAGPPRLQVNFGIEPLSNQLFSRSQTILSSLRTKNSPREGDETQSLEQLEVPANLQGSHLDTCIPEDGQASSKRSGPTPLKILNNTVPSSKIQLIYPATPSRPVSQISTSGSSAISGTTLARALIANSFVLSDTLLSGHRNEFSTLTRADSATLPYDYASCSPYLQRLSMTESHTAVASAPNLVPTVPANADQLHVRPKTVARSLEPFKRQLSASGIPVREDEHSAPPAQLTEPDSRNESDWAGSFLITEDTSPFPSPSISEHAFMLPPEPMIKVSLPDLGSPLVAELSKPGPSSLSQDLVSVPFPSGFRKEVDNARDNHLSPDILNGGFSLPFSPITELTEEPSSSPRISYGSDSPPNSTPAPDSGKPFLSPSPASTIGNDRLQRPRGVSDAHPSRNRFLPIRGDAPSFLQISPSSEFLMTRVDLSLAAPRMSSVTSVAQENIQTLHRPPINRQRSGSAPSRIKPARGPLDKTSIAQSAADLHHGCNSTTHLPQTFTEAPSALSDATCIPIQVSPRTPPPQPSLEQQVLLTRAATSVYGARPSRRPSLQKMETRLRALSDAANQNEPEPADPVVEHNAVSLEGMELSDVQVVLHRESRKAATTMAKGPLDPRKVAGRSQSPNSRTRTAFSPVLSSKGPTAPNPLSGHPEIHSTSVVSSAYGSTGSPSSFSRVPHRVAPSILTNLSVTSYRQDASKTLLRIPSDEEISSSLQDTDPARNVVPSSPGSVEPHALNISNVTFVQPAMREAAVTVPIATTNTTTRSQSETISPLSSPHPFLSLAHDSAPILSSAYDDAATVAPPPYSSVFSSEQVTTEGVTNSEVFTLPHALIADTGKGFGANADRASQGSSSTPQGSRYGRPRPPLPIGPRRPSQISQEWNGSTPSTPVRRVQGGVLPSPKFEAPQIKFRGLTLDAARWTFTSTELQAVTSRAIRQASVGSSIRLLRLETLENEIPSELGRLQMQKNDVKHKYKVFARRRGNILESLSCLDGSDPEDPGRVVRLVEDLKDVAATLDRLAEELHGLDEQHEQIIQLCEQHTTSALSVALWKLSASIRKQQADSQVLHQQIQALQAERDDAWKQAEDMAVQYDALKSGGLSEDGVGHVFAARKLSMMAPGLCSATPSSSFGGGSSSSSRWHNVHPTSGEGVSGQSRPMHIMTDLPLRSSVGLSTGRTPTPDTMDMMRVQADLYEMLGLQPTNKRIWRSRSVEDLASPSYSCDSALSTGHRLSLPGSPSQLDAYNALLLEPNRFLAL